ncbi:FKBP-type peptidyl-prolyl cis-trans isomerase [Mariniflexile sp. HMF6888]|uniref:FKBP-type peptidyl-prolyl cis-trans isomerase n=1 Tax=Mariniflexile sp. HMF6888 TaxID=3373086 RepID=UPI0037BC0E0E
MNLRKVSLYLLCLTIGVLSCKKDDEPDPIVIEIRDRTEQQLADMDSLVKYLSNHYYNSSEIAAALPNAGINDIKITKLVSGASVPDGHTLLLDAVGAPKEVVYAETDYEYYVLKLNQGGGDSPTFADNVQILYEGFTLNNIVFDYKFYPNSNLFDLTSVISGWQNVIPDFNTSESFTENSDGTVSYNNSGLGVMFLPSGLAYFSNASGGIPAYSPLIFKFELLQMAENDHDGDGIPSYLEDVDGNDVLTDNTDDDTYRDNSGFIRPLYNYIDNDDDGDGILTKNEITISTINKPTKEEVKGVTLEYNQVLLNKIKKEQNGSYTGTIITFKDTDGVGPFDYLDKNY